MPALRGGKPIIVESEPDWYVKQVMEDFVVRAERIRGGGVDPSEDSKEQFEAINGLISMFGKEKL